MRGHSKKMAIYKPTRGLAKNQPSWHLDLGRLASRTVRKEISVEATQLVVFCYGSSSSLIPDPMKHSSILLG